MCIRDRACFIRYAGVKSLKEYTASSLNLYICTIHSLNNRNNYEKEFAFCTEYFDGLGTILPPEDTEAFKEFADFEKRMLWHKEHTF